MMIMNMSMGMNSKNTNSNSNTFKPNSNSNYVKRDMPRDMPPRIYNNSSITNTKEEVSIINSQLIKKFIKLRTMYTMYTLYMIKLLNLLLTHCLFYNKINILSSQS